MATGRCAGCGRTDSHRKISLHIVDCHKYLELFQQHPERCLAPVAEHERYRTEDNSPVARAEQRGTRLTARFAEINQHHQRTAARWRRPKDILD
jgi:hypothetical protein